MNKTETRFPFIIRVMGKRMGHPDNIRHMNCDSLAAMEHQFKRARDNPDNHKVEVLAVLETWSR